LNTTTIRNIASIYLACFAKTFIFLILASPASGFASIWLRQPPSGFALFFVPMKKILVRSSGKAAFFALGRKIIHSGQFEDHLGEISTLGLKRVSKPATVGAEQEYKRWWMEVQNNTPRTTAPQKDDEEGQV
jgi:hypothetical protein